MPGMIAFALWLKDVNAKDPFNEWLAPERNIWSNFQGLVDLATFGLELLPNKGYDPQEKW